MQANSRAGVSASSEDLGDEDSENDVVVQQILRVRKARLQMQAEKKSSTDLKTATMRMLSTNSYPSEEVYSQYLEYPYPFRDPNNEKEGFCFVSPSNLLELNHFVFRSNLPLEQFRLKDTDDSQTCEMDSARTFRVLVAGCGTGDAVILLSEQLSRVGVLKYEVVGLDPSSRSLEIAEARSKMHRFRVVPRFIEGDMEKVIRST
eukprot:CAMPEP_0184479932 /NCGR_PEP_ID=MMETSP0113_2-20130426/1457_1 /TAXON_ID=91329 /ORGANISM="Norrisiella sphaerica, Strain BC52" /LENGTH=203 /DNA_ID=CAMNT_0026858107 /DNA_START=30 /DNA_END=641 /DNA_ORIENTATION=-